MEVKAFALTDEKLAEMNEADLICKLDAYDLRRRKRLIICSIAYNYIAAVAEFVFGKKLRRKLRAIEDVKSAKKNIQEQAQWDMFEKEHWKEEFEDIIYEFKGGCKNVAHPVTLDDGDETTPALMPKDLCDIIKTIYKSREIRDRGQELVEDLDKLTRTLSIPLLQ